MAAWMPCGSRGRGKEINNEQVDALVQQFGRLLDERAQGVAAALLPGETISIIATTRSPLTCRTAIRVCLRW